VAGLQGQAGAPPIENLRLSALGDVEAGDVVKIRRDGTVQTTGTTSIIDMFIIHDGTVRITGDHRRSGGVSTSILSIIKNGTTAQSWSTTSGSFVSRSFDLSVAVGDRVVVQLNDDGDGNSEARNVRFRTNGGSIWPFFNSNEVEALS
jgi:hypothetical protein